MQNIDNGWIIFGLCLKYVTVTYLFNECTFPTTVLYDLLGRHVHRRHGNLDMRVFRKYYFTTNRLSCYNSSGRNRGQICSNL